MIFPALRPVLKKAFSEATRLAFDSEPISLDLKDAGFSFGTTDVPSADWLVRNGYYQIAAALGAGNPAWSGEAVSITTALQHSAVWACNRIISESIGFLPANVMQEKNGAKREAVDHPMSRAMKNAPNSDQTAQAFSETGTSHCLLTGMAYARIIRRTGTNVAIELEPFLMPDTVLPDREKSGQKRLMYTLHQTGQSDKTFFVTPGQPHDLLVLPGLGWNGIRGFDVISMGRNSIGSAIAQEKNIGRFWANGGRVPHHIERADSFRNEEDLKNFAIQYNQVKSDPHHTVVFERGIKPVNDALTMKDAQALESRQWTVSEIARWFSISPHLIQDLSRATYSNIEHLALEFVKTTLNTWLVRWEQNFYRCVLTPAEQAQGYYLKHNLNALLRGEFQTRMAGYATALQNGWLNIDEVRSLEDLNPLDNNAGEGHHIQLNMQTIQDGGTLASDIAEQQVTSVNPVTAHRA